MKPKKIIMGVVLALAPMTLRAQFTMGGVGSGTEVKQEIPVVASRIDAHVLNETEARLLKRKAWHAKNAVDYKVSLTGMATQFNKSWTTNNQNSVSSELAAYYYHTYTKDKFSSSFKFDGIYGMNLVDDVWFKNQDFMRFYYLMSWKVRDRGVLKNWSYSFENLFYTQFTEGYKSRTEKILWSNFMAPGTLEMSLGFTYNSPDPKFPFILTVNPVSGKGLFVLDERLSDDRRKQLGIPDPRRSDGSMIKYKLEGGASVNLGFNRTFDLTSGGVKLQYIGTARSFYGWMTQVGRHTPAEGEKAVPLRPTMDWTNRLIFSPLKYLSVEFRTRSVYDHSQVDKLQMEYYLRVGLTYGYKNR